MKKSIWYIGIFLGCFLIGMLTRGMAKAIPIYGFHAVLAALPMALWLTVCFEKTKEAPMLLQCLPVLLFGLVLGMMSPIMAFYNIGAIVLAMGFSYSLPQVPKSAKLAFGYAFAAYPLAVLGGVLFHSEQFQWTSTSFCISLVLTAALSFVGVKAGSRLCSR